MTPAPAPGPPMGVGSGRLSASDRLPWPWLFPLLIFAATWILIVASWTLGARLIVPGYHALHWYSWLWYKDVSWYWGVALYWYAPAGHSHVVPVNAAWFPVFPGWLRLWSYVALGNKFVGALLAQIISGGASSVLIWLLASRIRGHWVADRAVILFCAFPGAMMLAGAYSESLGIALVTASLLAAVNRRWLLAGLFGLLTTAEHPTLVVIVPALGLTALHAISGPPGVAVTPGPSAGAAGHRGLLRLDRHSLPRLPLLVQARSERGGARRSTSGRPRGSGSPSRSACTIRRSTCSSSCCATSCSWSSWPAWSWCSWPGCRCPSRRTPRCSPSAS